MHHRRATHGAQAQPAECRGALLLGARGIGGVAPIKMKTVFVTGSSRGIGLGIARAFAKQGDCNLVMNGRDRATLSAAAAEISNNYAQVNVLEICTDLSDYTSAKKAFKSIESKFGAVDVLINNAGVAHFGLFSDMTFDDIQKVLADNLYTALNASHVAVPYMVKAKAGCIINITSVWGLTGASCEVVYSTAKAGMIGLTKSLAKELAPSGIRVNAIACGAFETRMNSRLDAEEKNAFMESIPMGRFGLPHEAGELAVFLASDKAAYLTGQVIALDGGL